MSNPEDLWLHAAELAALVSAASELDWGTSAVTLPSQADELADLVYRGELESPRLYELVFDLDVGLFRHWGDWPFGSEGHHLLHGSHDALSELRLGLYDMRSRRAA